ncbi:MAG: hypothetical protein K2J38_03640 [Muribaculaceae bacterium]|nr:hypothetical protein [Muribaculaceae bacterium]
MKKTLITLVVGLLGILSSFGQGFYAGLEGARLFGVEKCTNWEIGAFASYSHKTSSRFGFEAQAGFYTQIYDDAPVEWLGGPVDDRANTFGGKMALCGFVRVVGPVAILTGPVGSYNFYQKGTSHDFDGPRFDIWINRAELQWRLGLMADIQRFRVRVCWDHDLTNRWVDEKLNAITLSVAFRLKP